MYKVLIADDEFLVQVGLRSLIDYKALGLSLIGIAQNGEEALRLIGQEHPDIVLLDIKMPKMTGIEVMEQLSGFSEAPLFILLTNYEDFDYARAAMRLGAFDYIMKAELSDKLLQDTLTKAIDKLNRQHGRSGASTAGEIVLKEKFYQKLLNNWFPSEELLLESMEELHIPRKSHYAIVYFSYANAALPQENNLKTTAYLCSMIEEIFAKYGCCYVTPWNFRSFTVVAGLDEKESAPLGNCIEKTIVMVRQYINQELWAGVGRTVLLPDIPISFNEAMIAVKQCSHERPLLYYACLNDQEKSFLGKPFNMAMISHNLTEAIESYHIPQIHSVFAVLRQLFAQQDGRLNQAIATLSGLLHFISISFKDPEEMLHYLLPQADDPFYALEHVKTISQAMLCFDCIEEALCRRVEHDFEYSKNWIVPNIKKYIEENYDKPLSLTDVSQAFDISTGYISTLFKKNNDGVGFSECVTQAKIIRAKQLLTETNMKIYEISDSLGYSDPYYFSKVFKKVTGCAPKDYANQFKKGGLPGKST